MLDFSPMGWGRVILWTVLGTLGCIAVTFVIDHHSLLSLQDHDLAHALLLDIGIPLLLAGPLLLFFSSKLRELAIANDKLMALASTDMLTSVLSRGAFTELVEGYLRQIDEQSSMHSGALLVLDADNFKDINDAFGHQNGDVALKLIADTCGKVVRGIDRIGRLGGEEFGIFLPGSSREQAASVAERIRAAVRQARFAPDGKLRPLSVSIGGIAFEGRMSYSELFREADSQLYRAKQQGRDRVSISPQITRYLPLQQAS